MPIPASTTTDTATATTKRKDGKEPVKTNGFTIMKLDDSLSKLVKVDNSLSKLEKDHEQQLGTALSILDGSITASMAPPLTSDMGAMGAPVVATLSRPADFVVEGSPATQTRR